MTPPFFHKLWDKGVDIGAGVIAGAITSAIVAGIGLVSWKIKLALDLRADAAKQKQQHQLKQEWERQDERDKEKARRAALPEQREQFAAVAEKAHDRDAQAELWNQVRHWMKSGGLLEIKTNLEIYNGLAAWSQSLRNASSDANVERNALNLAQTTHPAAAAEYKHASGERICIQLGAAQLGHGVDHCGNRRFGSRIVGGMKCDGSSGRRQPDTSPTFRVYSVQEPNQIARRPPGGDRCACRNVTTM